MLRITACASSDRTMNAETWEEQIRVHDDLGQFTLHVPTLDDLLDMRPLQATASDRPRLGAGRYAPVSRS